MRLASAVMSALCCVSAVAVSAAPAVTFEPHAVIVSGVTPGAATAWFAISQDFGRYPARIVLQESLGSGDERGTLRIEQQAVVEPTSIWAVADLQSGAVTIAAPPRYRMKQGTLPVAALRRRTSGVEPRLELAQDDAELFYVRPRVGAWRLTGGGRLALRSMRPVGDAPAAPADFAAGDVIVVVEPLSMNVRTLRVR